MKLPEVFTNRMTEYLTEKNIGNADDFFASFDLIPLKGIRLNRNKVNENDYPDILNKLGEDNNKVSWCSSGYYTESDAAGNDPYYHAGVYYPQEPSAMLPAEVMAAKPGDYVLDLCAAPGGKACRLGEDLNGEGLLVANEISENRAKALLRNIERMGIKNCVILNETPENMAGRLPGFFDKILVDAPCSGEGMFRRDPNAVKSWEKYGPEPCVKLQSEVLESADVMLKPGGELVYSTCTFCVDEDELQIVDFMNKHPYYEVIHHPEIAGVTHNDKNSILPGSMRIWPHLSDGDGHFCVHLRKLENSNTDEFELSKIPSYKQKRSDNYGFGKSREALLGFMKDILTPEAYKDYSNKVSKEFVLHNQRIHLMPVPERTFDRLKIVKMGSFPGEIKNTTVERLFIPSNSLAMEFNISELNPKRCLRLTREDPRLIRYLKGETITGDDNMPNKGYIVICVDEFPLGFGKMASGSIKNLYPKAWRLS